MTSSASIAVTNMASFIKAVIIGEVLLRQIPMSLGVAGPSFLVDLVVALGFHPQQELTFHAPQHANFSAHFQNFLGGERIQGGLANFGAMNLSVTITFLIMAFYLAFFVPYTGLGGKTCRAVWGVASPALYALFSAACVAIIVVSAKRANDPNGPHAIAPVGTLSSTYVIVILMTALLVNVGWRFKAHMGSWTIMGTLGVGLLEIV